MSGRGANEGPVRIDVSFSFTYHTKDGGGKKLDVKAHEFHMACFEFHAVMQLANKLDRDGYTIDRVQTNHTTVMSSTPQVYLPEDLPPRNPDASKFTLPEALRKRIYPENKAAKGKAAA